jgi:CDP-glycerol glycerophosphotransferase (TagB/SpsB family)
MPHRAAGFIYGPLEHHLDHLAPFCSLMQIPLVLTDEELLQKARLYYPDLKLLQWDCLEAPFEIVRSFDTIFYSTPRCMFDEVFFIAETTLRKKIRTIWLPHGNSDKGHASALMEGLKDEENLLVYGPKMVDFLKAKNVSRPSILLGNFRLEYYRRHQQFYDSLVEKLALPSKKTILYAPTWQDGENSTSFFQVADPLIQQLPSDALLLVKLHPNLEKDIRVIQFMLQNETHPNIRFLSGFTPVYPILEKADLYLGDMSSIGYDFLTFNRPMFFFNPTERDPSDQGRYLHQCGETLQPDQIFNTLSHDQSHLTPVRLETYAYTFGEKRNWNLIQQEILQQIR